MIRPRCCCQCWPVLLPSPQRAATMAEPQHTRVMGTSSPVYVRLVVLAVDEVDFCHGSMAIQELYLPIFCHRDSQRKPLNTLSPKPKPVALLGPTVLSSAYQAVDTQRLPENLYDLYEGRPAIFLHAEVVMPALTQRSRSQRSSAVASSH